MTLTVAQLQESAIALERVGNAIARAEQLDPAEATILSQASGRLQALALELGNALHYKALVESERKGCNGVGCGDADCDGSDCEQPNPLDKVPGPWHECHNGAMRQGDPKDCPVCTSDEQGEKLIEALEQLDSSTRALASEISRCAITLDSWANR